MNSSSPRLETVKPAANIENDPQAPVVAYHAFKVESRETTSKSHPRRKRKTADRRYKIQESQAEEMPKSWLSRLLSGWMFSLLIHSLLILWLGSLITNVKTDGGLTLNVSMYDEAVSDSISIDIAPMVDLEFDEAGGGALDPEVVEPEVEELEDEIQPLEDPTQIESIPEKLLFESASDDSMFEPVNMGTVGLDKGEKGGNNGDGKGEGKGESVTFFGIESSGNEFIFVIDCSGSMGDERRYQRAVYELSRSMDIMETNHRFLVILYNSETFPMLGMTEKNIDLISATRTNKERVVRWLKRQQPDTLTMPLAAMQMSLLLRPSSIYFLSDGEFHDGTIPMLQRFNVDDSATGMSKIPINTITLGSTGIGAPMMKHIADQSGGKFHWAR